MNNLDDKLWLIQKSTRTLFPVFLGLHNFLRTKFPWYSVWHLNKHFKQVHYGSLGIYSILVIALAVWIGVFQPLSVSASTNTKIWNTKSDFESGTISNLDKDTSSGHLTLPQTTNTTSEDFATTTNYNSGSSSQVNWDTTSNKLTLAGGDEGVVTDMTTKLNEAWGSSETIQASTYDSTNHFTYLGGSQGSFLAYNSATETTIDLTAKISADWSSSYPIYTLIFDSTNSKVYLGGSGGKFGVFTGGADPANGIWVYLTAKVSANWSTSSITALTFDSANSKVYLGGGSGKFGVFSGGADPANGTWIYLNSKISADWSTSGIFALAFDSTNNKVYLGGEGGKFGVFTGGADPANGTWVYLTAKISADWMSNYINTLTFDSANSKVYLGGTNGRFGVFTGGADPANGTWVYLSAKISADWDTYTIYTLTFDSANSKVYLGGNYGKFGVFAGGADPANGTWVYLTAKISANWSTTAIYSIAFDSTNNKVYLGGTNGKFGVFTGGADPANGTWAYLYSQTSAYIKTYPIYSTVYADGYIYLGGGSGKFAAYNPASDTLIDLTAKISISWGTSYPINSLVFDSTNSKVYLGGAVGRFGVFTGGADPANGTWVYLTAKISADWGSSYICTLAFDSTNSKVYLGGDAGRFGVFTGGADPANGTWVYLTAKISADWSTNSIYALTFDSANSKVYLGGNSGRFGVFTGGADPANGTWVYLSAKISADWGSYYPIHALTFDSSNGKIYLGGQSGRFGVFTGGADPANGTWVYLTAKISDFWSSNTISSFAFSGSTLYLAGGNTGASRFAKYNIVTETATDLSATLVSGSTPFGSYGAYPYMGSLVQVSNVTYIGGYGVGALAKYELGYKSSGYAVTNALDSVFTNIKSATLSATETKPADTVISYQLSGDGGSHWEDASLDTLHSFTNAGSDLRIKISLSTTDVAVTPEITAFSLSYTSLNNYTGSINLIHDGTRAVNFYSISQSASVPTGSSLSYKVRTASTQAGLASATWGDSIASTSLPYSLTSVTTDNQFIEIQADFVSSNGLVSPDLDSLTLDYIDNDIPLIQNLNASYATDGSNNLSLSYQIKDTDTDTNPSNPNQASISFQYSTDSGNTYHDFTSSAISGTKGLTAINKSSYTTKSTIINLSTDLASQYSDTFVIKVIINDNELARNTANTNSSTMEIDTKAPASLTYSIQGAIDGTQTLDISSITATDDTTLSQMIISTSSSFSGASWRTFAAAVSNFSANSGDTIYLKVKDSFGNQSTVVTRLVPVQVTNVIINDLSNSSSNDYRLVVGWHAQNIDEVSGYKIYRKVNNGSYALISTINDKTVNLYGDPSVDTANTYSYLVYAVDNEGSQGISSQTVSAKPAFAPTISNVTVSAIGSDRATVSWNTDTQADSFVEFGIDTSYGAIQGTSDLTTEHSFTITGLNSNTEFTLRARSRDQKGTLAISESQKIKTLEEEVEVRDETSEAASIKSVSSSDIDFDSVDISWETTVITKTKVIYGDKDLSNTVEDQSPNNYTTQHKIKIENLSQGTIYTYRVIGEDMLGNKYASDNYSFSTLSLPGISNVKAVSTGSYTATVSWDTNTDTNSYVIYSADPSNLSLSSGVDQPYTKQHIVNLISLTPATTYYLKTKSTDSFGNSVYSDIVSVSTTIDTKAPIITNLRSETYLMTDESGNSKVQAIISWNTDEPASSLIKYSEGVAASKAYANSSPDDPALTTSHVVILASLKPSTTYHVIAISKDSSNNTATSNDYTVLTKRQEKSITQIIVQILEENFSWLKKLKIL